MHEFIDLVVTTANGGMIVDELNAAFKANEFHGVNGHEPVSRFGQPVARQWQNGTISVTVKGRTKGKINDLYIKVGQRIRAFD